MDTELARTFLAVVAGGSFVAAADRLHVTQSTVSARIRALEDRLGAPLFTRNKAGAAMTEAGRRFQKYASLLVSTVEQARQDIGLPKGYSASILVGGRLGLWEGLMLRWLAEIRRSMPQVAVRAEVGFEADLMQGLVEGRIDLGVMYTPQRRPNLDIQHLLDERLVLVTTAPSGARANYLHVDWGPEFFAQFAATYPEAVGPPLTVNVGWLGLSHLLAEGGSAYFPRRLVSEHLAAGRLRLVASAPEFLLPAYVVTSGPPLDPVVANMRKTLISIAKIVEQFEADA